MSYMEKLLGLYREFEFNDQNIFMMTLQFIRFTDELQCHHKN